MGLLIRPILFRLVSSFGVEEGAQHHNDGHIFVVNCLPKIVISFDRGLAENGKDFSINQRSHFVCVDVIIFEMLDVHSAVLIYLTSRVHVLMSEQRLSLGYFMLKTDSLISAEFSTFVVDTVHRTITPSLFSGFVQVSQVFFTTLIFVEYQEPSCSK